MRRLVLSVLLAFGLASSAWAIDQYDTEITATVTSQTISFGFPARSVLLINDDATISVHVDFSDGVATTANFELKAGESVSIPPLVGDTSQLGIIAASGTPTVRILALR